MLLLLLILFITFSNVFFLKNHFGFYKTKKKYQCRSVNNS